MSKTEIKRLPRPLGLTGLMFEYHKQDEQDKAAFYNNIKNILIHQWLLSNGTLCGTNMSQNSLALFLNCDVQEIQIHMRDKLMNNRIWDRDIQEQMLNGLMGQQIMWAMEDRMDVQAQVDLLKASQGLDYKPFISSEVNKALKLKLDSTNAIQSIIKSVSGPGSINIFAPVQNNLNQDIHQGVTPQEALDIIQSQLLELGAHTKESDTIYLENKYDFDDKDRYPEVIASSQVGKGEKEGLNILKKEHTLVVDNYKLHRTEKAELDHHEFRREIDDGIEPEDWDPELDQYPDVEEE